MTNLKMTDLEKDLRELIGGRRGAGNPISRTKLMEFFDDVPERKVRKGIKHLLIKHGVPIASCPDGYYTPVTPEEVDRACRYYHGYAMACLTAESKLRGCSLPDLVGQLTMKFKKEVEENHG